MWGWTYGGPHIRVINKEVLQSEGRVMFAGFGRGKRDCPGRGGHPDWVAKGPRMGFLDKGLSLRHG